jgi:putative endonuclease
MSAWVYILASQPGGTLYVGVTKNLGRRVFEHREGLIEDFTQRYRVKTLVYYEQHETILLAIQRERTSSTGLVNGRLICCVVES